MQAEVSIVVPVYNVPEHFLRKCIESLMAQTLKEIEIILVDDGSTDLSGKICDEYAKQDNRIFVIHKENGGLAAARNTGAQAAKGKWLVMVDGDDWIEPDACLISSRAGDENNAQVVCCGTIKDFGEKKITLNSGKFFEDGRLYQGQECKYFQKMVLRFDSYVCEPNAKLFLRKYIEDRQLYHNETLRQGMEGIDFCLRVFENIDRVLYLDDHWYHYMYNSQSISAQSTEKNNTYVIRCLEEIGRYIESRPNKNELQPEYFNRILYVVITSAISGYFHPKNKEPYKKRCQNFSKFIDTPVIKDALHKKINIKIDMQRNVILFLIRYKMFWALELLGIVRYKQKMSGRKE